MNGDERTSSIINFAPYGDHTLTKKEKHRFAELLLSPIHDGTRLDDGDEFRIGEMVGWSKLPLTHFARSGLFGGHCILRRGSAQASLYRECAEHEEPASKKDGR